MRTEIATIAENDLIIAGSLTHHFVRVYYTGSDGKLSGWLRSAQPYYVGALVEVAFTEKQDRLGNSYEQPFIKQAL
jgi:hypothetical protein